VGAGVVLQNSPDAERQPRILGPEDHSPDREYNFIKFNLWLLYLQV
jgi:hypothetical protein